MELESVIHPKIWVDKNYDDIILYALSKQGPLQRTEFKELNKTTFYKYLNRLISDEYIESYRESKII